MTSKAKAELQELLVSGVVTNLDVKVLLRWVDEVAQFGPGFIAQSNEWHDHALDGEWRGYRSSAYCKSGRVIYRVIDKEVIVEVHRVTNTHNYKRG